MQQQSGDGEQEGVSEWFQTSFGLVFWVPPALGDEKRKRKGRERERERQREEEGKREREIERERGRWKMETNRRRERERQREEEGEERESVVNGEQRVVSEYVLGACFSGPLHVFPDRDIYN